MIIKKITLSWILSSDINKAQKFFVDTLGLKVLTSAPEHQWLELSGQETGGSSLGVGQINEKDGMQAGTNAVVTMSVDDIEAARKELEAKGVKFFGETMEVPGHVKLATFTDPDGNMFQLVQELYQQTT